MVEAGGHYDRSSAMEDRHMHSLSGSQDGVLTESNGLHHCRHSKRILLTHSLSDVH